MLANNKSSNISRGTLLILLSAIIFISSALISSRYNPHISKNESPSSGKNKKKESIEAFLKVYEVLTHPRCMNCHPAGDIPLQGEDSHLHSMEPTRGLDGKGLFAMKCMNCHLSEGMEGENMPPGSPNWHMPPADMKMVFEGKSANELALQIVDPKQNGNKSMKDLIAHADDELVKAGWEMGGNRELPPLTYEEFKQEWIKWIETGAYAPPAK